MYWHPCSLHICEQVGDLAHALATQWKRMCMAYSPPREEQEGQFLDDMSFSEEEEDEMGEVVTVLPDEDSPDNTSDEFDYIIWSHHHIHCTWSNVCTG